MAAFDKTEPFPTTLAMLRQAELQMHSGTTLRKVDFKDIPIPVSRTGLRMINEWEDLKCVTYDIFDVARDLLNDGEHAKYATFRFTPEFDQDTGERIYGEIWSANWWKREQALLGAEANILAFVLYVDETHVTYNGRNMHPIYMSLANLHLTYRCAHNNVHLQLIELFINMHFIWFYNDFTGKNCLARGFLDFYLLLLYSQSTRATPKSRDSNAESYARQCAMSLLRLLKWLSPPNVDSQSL